ncbi:ABC transporter ATP-binding protein [Marinobacter sp.]|uniref:ABC transporter ATP-binding protein n=1 Tax=Marinobacter sp. TaxID=50741 RepID=UPI0035673F2C
MANKQSTAQTNQAESNSSGLEISNLKIWFDTPSGPLRAVDNVSLSVNKGEIVALVGESGSGKSVTSLAALKLINTPPGRFVSGSITLNGQNILAMTEQELESVRGTSAAMLFQNPRGSLDPSFTIQEAFQETLSRHQPGLSPKECREYIETGLRQVGFNDWERVAASYPHQLSGGMCQRVALAITFACNPDLLIADEPTTALDVGIQAKVLFLLRKLNIEHDLPILLITHDFGVVRAIAHRVVVMYAGHIQEEGPVDAVLCNPQHPYTRSLIKSVPDDVGNDDVLYQIPGTPPDLVNPPAGCRFADRCELAVKRCREELPELRALAEDRTARCHLIDLSENKV